VGRHTGSCANAIGHACHCSGCAGTLHRWQGCVALARQPDATRRQDFRRRVDGAWNTAHRPPPKRRRVKPTNDEKAAATDSAVVDIVDWLAEYPSVTDEVGAIATVLGNGVIDALDQSFDASSRDARHRDLADHFWCDLLAALAQMMHTYQQQVDQIPEHLSNAIIAARACHGHRSSIDDEVVKLAVLQSWTLIQKIPFVKAALPNVDQPLRVIRILAVLICPAPEDHQEVAQHCLHPLTGELASAVTKQRLTQFMPDNWMS
jgi:hypothetical protein